MTSQDRDASLERYRTEFFKLRSVLHDRTTDLTALPVVISRLRTLLDSRRHLGVLHVEIANLDVVESLYGWQVFDRVLERVSEVLKGELDGGLPRQSIVVINGVGGDRFAVFVPDGPRGDEVDVPWLSGLAADVRERLETAFDVEEFAGLSPRLEFRTGHALCSEDPFYRFERRVYAAVDEARTLSARRESLRDRSGGAEVKRIIRDEAVSTVFQPVVDLETREILGYEALSRGPKDTRFEMPGPMFAMSDRAGVAADLDRLCRTHALRVWKSGAGHGKVFVNVLPGSLADPGWLDGGIDALIDSPAVGSGDVVLEVSERASDAEIDRFAAVVDRLQDQGVEVALDDVGTGYATLATLEKIRPRFLKLDTSIVHDIQHNLIKQELMSSLVQIAERLGATVIAEGVESREEAAVVREAGARYGQGYFFARPETADDAFARRRTDR
jgi:EAL domain-containing protein (putative c-di-GMP-specific phosphodiesterase class I)/GGDEF domain-containing protein